MSYINFLMPTVAIPVPL